MTLGVGLALLFTVGWIPLYFSRAETVGRALPSYEPREKAAIAAAVTLLCFHAAAGCVLVSLEADIGYLRAGLAAAIYVAGIGFWFWGRRLIGPLKARRLPDQPPLEFRRDGAFGVVRHPLYFGCLLALAAPVVATLSGWLVASFTVCVLLLGLRAIQEERRLRAQLGVQYDAYSEKVKRLVPFIW